METQKLGYPTSMGIYPSEDKKLFRFRLEFHEHRQPQLVEFETDAVGAMAIMKALQNLQARYKIPIPASLRPQGDRPNLRIVTPDE